MTRLGGLIDDYKHCGCPSSLVNKEVCNVCRLIEMKEKNEYRSSVPSISISHLIFIHYFILLLFITAITYYIIYILHIYKYTK